MTLAVDAVARYAADLNATAADIDRMSMEDRLAFVRALRSGAATELGVGDRWRNIEGVVAFFAANGLGAPGSWVSWVNAGVLEGIERGLAMALNGDADDYGNAGAPLWERYIQDHRAGRLAIPRRHDESWGEAKAIGTDYGVLLAERVHGTTPLPQEARFLQLAELYNWAMRNRQILNVAVTWGSVVDPRLAAVTPEFVDRFIAVGDADMARRGCEVAWVIAQQDPGPGMRSALQLVLGQLPTLLDLVRSGR